MYHNGARIQTGARPIESPFVSQGEQGKREAGPYRIERNC